MCVVNQSILLIRFVFVKYLFFNLLCVSQSNILDRAVDWIFSHLDDLESMDVSEGGRSAAESEGGRDPPPGPRVRDGPGSEFR